MIAPRTRLIVLTASLGGAAAIAVAIFPAISGVMTVLASIAIVSAAMDAWQANRAACGLRVDVPALTRAARGRAFQLPLRISNSGTSSVLRLRAALEVPPSFAMTTPRIDSAPKLADGKATESAAVYCCPRRGEYQINRCWFDSVSRLGLWSVRTSAPVRSVVKVYPDIAKDKTAAEFLRRGRAGARIMQMTGKGREFSRLREYLPDDPWEDVDWKSTARRGKPVVRTWRAERDQEVYVAIDASRLSARPAGDETILDRYVHSALVLELAAQAQGDRFGLISFSDRVHRFVRARAGKQHFTVCREAIYCLQPRPVEPDFGELFAFLETRLTRRALVVILTSLDDPLIGETFARHVGMASRRHLVLAAMPQPAGARPLFSRPATDTHEAYSALAGHIRWRQLAELRKGCERQGVPLHLLDPDRVSGQLSSVYLEVKQRQRL